MTDNPKKTPATPKPKSRAGRLPLIVSILGMLLLIVAGYVLVMQGIPTALGAMPTAQPEVIATREPLIPPTRDTALIPTSAAVLPTQPAVVPTDPNAVTDPNATPTVDAPPPSGEVFGDFLDNLNPSNLQQQIGQLSAADFGLSGDDWTILSAGLNNMLGSQSNTFTAATNITIDAIDMGGNRTSAGTFSMTTDGYNGATDNFDTATHQMVFNGSLNQTVADANGNPVQQQQAFAAETRFINNRVYVQADGVAYPDGSQWGFVPLETMLNFSPAEFQNSPMMAMGGGGIDPAMLNMSGSQMMLTGLMNLPFAQYITARREADAVVMGQNTAHFTVTMDLRGLFLDQNVTQFLQLIALATGQPAPQQISPDDVNALDMNVDVYVSLDDSLVRKLDTRVLMNIPDNTDPNLSAVEMALEHALDITAYNQPSPVQEPAPALDLSPLLAMN